MEKELSLKSLFEEDEKIFEHNKHVAKYKPMLNNLRNTQLSAEEKRSALVVYDCLLNNVFSGKEKVKGEVAAKILVAVLEFYKQFAYIQVPEYNEIASSDEQFRNVKSFLRKQLRCNDIINSAASEYNTEKNINEHLKYRLKVSDEKERNSMMADIKKYVVKKPTFKDKNYQIPKELSGILVRICTYFANAGENVPAYDKLSVNEEQFWAVRKWFQGKFCRISKIDKIFVQDIANNIYSSMFVLRKLKKPEKEQNKISKVNEDEISKPLELSKEILDSYDHEAIEDVLKNNGRQYTEKYSLSEIINASDFSDISIDEIETIIRHNLNFSSLCETSYLFGKQEVHNDTVTSFKNIEDISANLVSKNPKMILAFYYRTVPKIMKFKEGFDFKQWAKDLSIPIYENANIDNQDLDYANKVSSFEYLHTEPYIPKFNLVYKFLSSRIDDNNKSIDQDTLSLIPKECTDILTKADIPDCINKIFCALDRLSELKTAGINNMSNLVGNLNRVINFMYENKIIAGEKPAELENNYFDPSIVDKIFEFFRVLIFHFPKLFDHEYSIVNSIKLSRYEQYLKTQFDSSGKSTVSPFKFLNVANRIIPKQKPGKNSIN